MIEIAICDKGPLSLSIIRRYLEGFAVKFDFDFNTHYFTEPQELIAAYENNKKYHILLLDMELGTYSGIELAHIIKKSYCPQVLIVFISVPNEAFYNNFQLQPYTVLSKPLVQNHLQETLLHLFAEIYDYNLSYFQVTDCHKRIHVIPYSDILYSEHIDSVKRLVHIQTSSQTIQVKGRLRSFHEKLGDYGFTYCHRSFIVNLSHIRQIDAHSLTVSNGDQLLLSAPNRSKILTFLDTSLPNHFPNMKKFP